jgi:hypothetical protein
MNANPSPEATPQFFIFHFQKGAFMATTHFIPSAAGWASQKASWGTSAAGRGHLRLQCQRSYDQSTNRSTLTFTAWGYSEYYAEASFQANEGDTIKVNGSAIATFHDNGSNGTHRLNVYRDTTWRQLGSVNGPNSWTVTLSHDAGGKLTANIQLDLTLFCTVGGITYVMRWTDSTAFTVTEPRGSAIESIPGSVSTGDRLNISMARASTAYFHKATVRCGSRTLYSSPAFGPSLSAPVPRDWFQSYPDDASLACAVSVQTYTDQSCTTALGDPAAASLTVNADSGMRPVLQSGYATAAAYNTGTAAAGIAGYVSGVSRARVSLDESKLDMSAAVGARLASVRVTGGGETAAAAPYLTGVLTGTATVTVTVTDSRGRSAAQSLTIPTMPYAPPSLSQARAFRCDSAGQEDESGNFCSVGAVGIVSPLEGQNSLSLSAALAQGAEPFGAAAPLNSGADSILGGTLDPDRKLAVRLRAADALGNAAETVLTLPPRVWAMKFRPTGRGVGFGMAPTEDNCLQLPAGWRIKIGDTVVAGGNE